MSLTQARPYRKPPISVPPYPFHFVGVLPDYTETTIDANFVDQMASNVSGDVLRLNVTSGNYGYLISPVSNGAITFIDLSGGAAGGWDGAGWPTDGTEGDTLGPETIMLDFGVGAEPWYLYRTDFQSLGNKAWKLQYARNQF